MTGPSFLFSQGVFYMRLSQLVGAEKGHITESNPLVISRTRRQGRPYLRFAVGKSASFIELPDEPEAQQRVIDHAVGEMTESYRWVVLDQ